MVIICTTCFDNQYLYILYLCMVLIKTAIISLNSINQLIFVMVKCGVLSKVRTESLNNI
jgi:hypothetical protein